MTSVRTYRNPLPFPASADLPTNPDPFVTRFRGRYYCFSSGFEGVNLSVSDDMTSWTSLGVVLHEPGRSEYWAPCMAYIDGRFYVYYSSRPAGSEDPHEETLRVASSASIEGPYEFERRFFDTFSLDPHVVRDPSGEWVMFYSTNEPTGLSGENAGTSILVDRMLSPTELAGSPRPIVLPSLDEEIFERNRFGSDRDWYTIEGASFFSHHGRGYLTYSGNAYVGEEYFIGYSTAELGADIADLDWRKHPNDFDYAPLVRRNEHVEGTGHNSIVAAPNLVDDWIVYHGRDAAEPIVLGQEQRVMRMDPLFYSGGALTTCAPSHAEQDAPALPTVSARFEGAGALPAGWSVVAGTAALDGDALATAGDADALVVHDAAVESYVAEVWLQATRVDTGARAGVVPWYRDEQNFVEACLDAASSTLVVRRRENGFTSTVGAWPIDAGSLEQWSVVRVERTFDSVRITVDEREAGCFSVPAGAAGVGLRSVRTAARFSAFALTEHVSLHGDSLRYLPRLLGAATRAELSDSGVLAASRRPVVLVGQAPDAGTAASYGFELLASWAGVEVSTAVTEQHQVSVRLTREGYRVALTEAGVETVVAEATSAALEKLSVRITRSGAHCIVRIGEAVVPVAVPAGPSARPDLMPRRIALVGARLTSLTQTRLDAAPLS